jgi:hypothetical protein
MATFHPLPLRARAQQTLMLLVATCLVSLAAAACTWARTAQPTATVSSTVLHKALIARAADKRLLAHRSSALTACKRTSSSRCTSQRRMVAQSRTKLARAERLVSSLSARIARRHHSSKGAPSPSGDSAGGSGGKGNAAKGDSTSESSGASGAGTSDDSTSGLGAGGESSIGSPGTPESSPGTGSGSPSSTFGEPFVKGIVTNIQGWGTSAMPQISSEMSSLGVNWAREDLSWADTEPHKGVFDWSGFDQMVSAAKAKGIAVLPIVGYAPSWAGPSDATDYAAFMQAAVERYGPGTPADLTWWELWNEPYDAYAWSGHTPEPEAYARDVLAAAQAARGVSSSVKLLVAADYDDSPQAGGTTPWQTSWIDDMFTAVPSLGEWINGVAVHPYGDDPSLPLAQTNGWKDTSGEWAFQRIDMVRHKFLAHGVNVPFWITEDGWSTWETSEATQAHDYSDLIEQVKDRPWIRALFPFCLREFEEKATNNQPGFGLLKFGTWQPKPAFYTLQAGLTTLS